MKIISNKKYNELVNMIEAQRNMRIKTETNCDLRIKDFELKIQDIHDKLIDIYQFKTITIKKTKIFSKISDLIDFIEKCWQLFSLIKSNKTYKYACSKQKRDWEGDNYE